MPPVLTLFTAAGALYLRYINSIIIIIIITLRASLSGAVYCNRSCL